MFTHYTHVMVYQCFQQANIFLLVNFFFKRKRGQKNAPSLPRQKNLEQSVCKSEAIFIMYSTTIVQNRNGSYYICLK